MRKRISKKRTAKEDAAQTAFDVFQNVVNISEDIKAQPKIDKAIVSAVMSQLGRKGGKIGGKRRLETMSRYGEELPAP
jgi:hypothetical protein